MAKKLYVASPFGFSEAGRYFMYKQFLPAIEEAGFEILDPWKLTSEDYVHRVNSLPEGKTKNQALNIMNKIIGKSNEKAIREAYGLVAVLDGIDVDSGVAAELAFASALEKPILGYRNDFRLASENISARVNMQVEHFIFRTGGMIASQLSELPSALKKIFGNSSN